MTARQPRRTRRRSSPGTTLPRPVSAPFAADEAAEAVREGPSSAVRTPRRPTHRREHHVTTDYGHVHRDLLTVLVIGLLVLGFIVGMSFVL